MEGDERIGYYTFWRFFADAQFQSCRYRYIGIANTVCNVSHCVRLEQNFGVVYGRNNTVGKGWICFFFLSSQFEQKIYALRGFVFPAPTVCAGSIIIK